LARQGRAVRLLEAERFPRHHVGESTLQGLFGMLDEEIGLPPSFLEAGFRVKTGGSFIWGQTRVPWSFHFTDSADPAAIDKVAFQVDRSVFDTLLLDHSRSLGVLCEEEATVQDVTMEAGRVTGVRYRNGDGELHSVSAKYVIDASGQRSVLARQLGIRRRYEQVRNLAVYGYWDAETLPYPTLGGDIEERDQSNILVVGGDGYWIWFIPLLGKISVGVVASMSEIDVLKEIGPDAYYHDRLAKSREATVLLSGVSQLADEPVRTISDWSHISDKLAGPGYFMVGDAAAFVDPILSSGVHLAVTFGINCGRAVNTLLTHGDRHEWARAWFEEAYRASYEDFRRMADAWYLGSADSESWFEVARDRIQEGLEGELSRVDAFTQLAAGTLTSGSFRDRICSIDFLWSPPRVYFSPVTNRYSYTVEARQRMSEYLLNFPQAMIPPVFGDPTPSEQPGEPAGVESSRVGHDSYAALTADVRLGVFSERGADTLSVAAYTTRVGELLSEGTYAPLHPGVVEAFSALDGRHTPRMLAERLGVEVDAVSSWLERFSAVGFLTTSEQPLETARPPAEASAP